MKINYFNYLHYRLTKIFGTHLRATPAFNGATIMALLFFINIKTIMGLTGLIFINKYISSGLIIGMSFFVLLIYTEKRYKKNAEKFSKMNENQKYYANLFFVLYLVMTFLLLVFSLKK
ncbi:MAG: hypothetical protein LUF87_03795 [Alistipes sp.]|nr:hypothetical protein [Alistipes sp.]